MDWRAFPELVRRRSLKVPGLPPLPPLPEDGVPGAGEGERQKTAWQVNPELFRTRIRPEQLNEATQ